MKTLKTVIGILIIIFGTKTIFQMALVERGAGLIGAFIGYAIFILFAILLFRSSYSKKKEGSFKLKNNEPVNSSMEKSKFKVPEDMIISSLNEQKESLFALKRDGVLNEIEFNEKLDIVNKKIMIHQIEKLPEYINLQLVYKNQLLTQEQYEEKLNKLIEDYKECLFVYGIDEHPLFTWSLFKLQKINSIKEISECSESDLYGRWIYPKGQFIFFNDKKNNTDMVELNWLNSTRKFGEWRLKGLDLIVKLRYEDVIVERILKIEELGSHVLIYRDEAKKYTLIKEQTS